MRKPLHPDQGTNSSERSGNEPKSILNLTKDERVMGLLTIVSNKNRRWPARGWAGLILVAICWALNWTLPGARTAFLFFPLWLGYILTADAAVQARTGSSLWLRSRKHFVSLFAVSAVVWWLFELINLRTSNWEYLGWELFAPLEFDLLATISFSTVIPAVFETAAVISTFAWMDLFASGPRIPVRRAAFLFLLLIGLAMFSTILIWAKIFYPFTWLSLVFIFEPINYWTGRPFLLKQLRTGDWRTVISLSLGALVCGFFWEMWNYYSFPKWIYHIPGLAFLRIFEMPLLGYAGYIPFGLELYALTNFALPPRTPFGASAPRWL